MRTHYRHTQFGSILVVVFLLSIVIAAMVFHWYAWPPVAIPALSILIICLFLFYSLQVEITLRSGKKYRIGTDEPDRLAATIREYIRK